MKFSEILKCAEFYLSKFDDALEFEDCKISRMIEFCAVQAVCQAVAHDRIEFKISRSIYEAVKFTEHGI